MAATLHGTTTTGVWLPMNIVVRFFTPNTDTEIHKSASVIDSSGDFYVYDAPVGTYDVGVKNDKSISNLEEDVVFTEGNTTTVDFGRIYVGDLNCDDYVTIDDRSLLYAAMGNKNTGDCAGYAGDWLIPEAAPAVGAIASSKFNRGLN